MRARATRDGGHLGPVIGAGIALGIGLGAFVDGIVLGALLSVHDAVAARDAAAGPPGAWGGAFHAAAWLVTLFGVGLMVRAARRGAAWSGRALAGAALAGWGVFAVVEGLVNHHLLGVHGVHAGALRHAGEVALLGLGVALIAAGAAVVGAPRGAALSPRP